MASNSGVATPLRVHAFETVSQRLPARCAVCQSLIGGLFAQALRCSKCRLIVHPGCGGACNLVQPCQSDDAATAPDLLRRVDSSGRVRVGPASSGPEGGLLLPGYFVVRVIGAMELRNSATISRQSPYVSASLLPWSSQRIVTRPHNRGGINPVWNAGLDNELLLFFPGTLLPGAALEVRLEVWSQHVIGSDSLLGWCHVDAMSYLRRGIAAAARGDGGGGSGGGGAGGSAATGGGSSGNAAAAMAGMHCASASNEWLKLTVNTTGQNLGEQGKLSSSASCTARATTTTAPTKRRRRSAGATA